MGRDEVGSPRLLACWYAPLTVRTRKVEGEAKGETHGAGEGSAGGLSVPLRRWEDWERSRLRKLKREERRRRDMERLHPGGFVMTENELLSAGGSQHEGSDAYSVASSEDDRWGQQVGGYNETSTQYPPPPVGLYNPTAAGEGALVGDAQLEAMLESGFDESPSHSPSRTPISSGFASRYQLSDNPSQHHLMSHVTTSRSGSLETSQTPSASSLSPHHDPQNHYPRPREAYGPLGPLDPGEKF